MASGRISTSLQSGQEGRASVAIELLRVPRISGRIDTTHLADLYRRAPLGEAVLLPVQDSERLAKLWAKAGTRYSQEELDAIADEWPRWVEMGGVEQDEYASPEEWVPPAQIVHALSNRLGRSFESVRRQLEKRRAPAIHPLTGRPVNEEEEDAGNEGEDVGPHPSDDPDEIQEHARRVRRGQPAFRAALLAAYDWRCAVTGDGPEDVLEAAHLTSHAETGRNASSNGILLRSDLHLLFDGLLLGIDPETLEIRLSDHLRDTAYWRLDGTRLRPRIDGSSVDRDALRDRWRRFRAGPQSSAADEGSKGS